MKNLVGKINFRKDESLDRLAENLNVAQFISYSSGEPPHQEFSRVLGFDANHRFASLTAGIEVLLDRSVAETVNIRSFRPDDPRSHEFVYGIRSVSEAEQTALRILRGGFHVIINETIDVNDGGVSGVLQGGVVEFSPDDTPRCVEKPGTASLPRSWGENMLRRIYGFPVEFDFDDSFRVEFSVHPRPCGWRHSHVIGWELEKIDGAALTPSNIWPNNFSRLIGDKAYGLMIAAEAGLPVPMTTVISRRIAPFSFGFDTGSAERWIRTCPSEQAPGKYTTHHGWLDPFALMADEDPRGANISSVLAQYAVRAQYSGALIVNATGAPIIEGTKGEGEAFMLGVALPEELPTSVIEDVIMLFKQASEKLGPVRFEWVHDGDQAWIVQLHKGGTATLDNVIFPGEAKVWREFEIAKGLPELRLMLETMAEDDGVVIVGQIGLTSHVADLLRKAKKPARLR